MREGWDPCLAVIINEKRKKKTRTIFHMISKNTIPLRIKRGSISSHRVRGVERGVTNRGNCRDF